MEVKELNLSADLLPSVRMKQELMKKSGAFPYSWRQRYFVLSGNMLCMFVNQTDPRPKKVVCVDNMTLEVRLAKVKRQLFLSHSLSSQDDTSNPKQPHALKLTSTAGVSLLISAPSADDLVRWKATIKQASYQRMFSRAQYALKFLDHCSTLLSNDSGSGAASASGEETKSAESGADGPTRMMNGQAMIDAIASLREDNLKLKQQVSVLEKQGGAMSPSSAAAQPSGGASPLAVHPSQAGNAAALAAVRKELANKNASYVRLEAEKRSLENSLKASQEEASKLSSELADMTASAAIVASAMGGDGNTDLTALRQQLSAASNASRIAEGRSRQLARELDDQRVRLAEVETTLLAAQQEAAQAKEEATRARLAAPQGVHSHPTTPGASLADLSESKSSMEGGGADKRGGVTGDAYEHEWLPFYKQAQELERAGRFTEAESHYQHVLDVRRERSGERSVAASAAARDLGRVLALQQNYARAEQYYAAAVDLCSDLQGESHPNTACALTDLAAVQREQGKLSEAERHARRAVESLRTGVGASDVSTGTALYNLAGLCRRQGKHDAAEEAYEGALAIFQEKLGDAQGETADTMYQLGCLYRKKGDCLRASSFFGNAATAYSNTYGPADRRVAEATRRQRAMLDKLVSANE